MESNVQSFCGNSWPNSSPMWSNTSVTSSAVNNYDGLYWYHWCPRDRWFMWYDSPMVEDQLDGNLCYRVTGNVWICQVPNQEPLVPNIVPYPESVSSTSALEFNKVKLSSTPDHVAVMFGQIISNLK